MLRNFFQLLTLILFIMNVNLQSARQRNQVTALSEADVIRLLEGRNVEYAPYKLTLRKLICRESLLRSRGVGGQQAQRPIFVQGDVYYMWVAVPFSEKKIKRNWMVPAVVDGSKEKNRIAVRNVPCRVFGNPLEAPVAQKLLCLDEEFVQVSDFRRGKLLIPSANLNLQRVKKGLKEKYGIVSTKLEPCILGTSSSFFIGIRVEEREGEALNKYVVNCFNMELYFCSGPKITSKTFTREIPLGGRSNPVIWDGMAVRYNSDTDTIEVQMLS